MRFPTLLGVGVLVIGLIAGIFIFEQGTGLFLPRATEETTPQNVKITNVTERSFSVSFATQTATSAFIKIDSSGKGGQTTKTDMQASDDRDQLQGSVGEYPLHHVTLTGLDPETEYYFLVGTGKGALFDNNGEKFMVKTTKRSTNAPNARTIYGSVVDQNGAPAKGSIVYVQLDQAGEMSQLVQDSGSWAIPLSNARLKDGSQYAIVTDDSELGFLIQGHPLNLSSSLQTTVGEFESGFKIVLGQTQGISQGSNSTESGKLNADPTPTATIATSSISPAPATSQSATLTLTPSPSASSSITLAPTQVVEAGALSELLANSQSIEINDAEQVIDLNQEGHQEVSTQQPTIVGSAPANVSITIKIHSDSQVETTLTSNSDGEFELNLAQLNKQLEPGEHVIEYSYIDPDTNELVTKTHTFTVFAPADTQLAQAYPSPTSSAYGTEYPYGTTPSPTPIPTGSDGEANSSTVTPTVSISITPTVTLTASQSANATDSSSSTKGGIATSSAGSASALPKSGVINTTLTLIFGGLFFLLAGGWSFWVAKEIERE
ncbi:MAG TPA: fibronectin type III domain-containing protein [Candidatus Woesebacteria bacterium]|nr:fibronectin type III domain-containing protein [Candidatus Woesebacteria bacterium]